MDKSSDLFWSSTFEYLFYKFIWHLLKKTFKKNLHFENFRGVFCDFCFYQAVENKYNSQSEYEIYFITC